MFLRNFVAKVDKPSVAKAAEDCRSPKRFAAIAGFIEIRVSINQYHRDGVFDGLLWRRRVFWARS
jgi:hypothetical protein